GVVRAIRVSDGTNVAKGEVLVELDPTANEADEAKLTHALVEDALDIARLKALLAGNLDVFVSPAGADDSMVARARHQLAAQAAEQDAKLSGLDHQIAQKRAEADEAAATVEKTEKIVPLLKGQRDIREHTMQLEFGSRLLFLQAEQQYVEAAHNLIIA